jgi:hypothetical protein
LNIWKKYFSQPLNVHGFNDIRQTEMHTGEPLAPEARPFEVTVENFRRYKSQSIDQILAGLIPERGIVCVLRSHTY